MEYVSTAMVIQILTVICNLTDPTHSEAYKQQCIDKYVNCVIEHDGKVTEKGLRWCVKVGGRIPDYE